MARGPNPRRVKIHRTYTVDELAACLGVHPHTVRGWIARGLETIDDQRPTLIEGRIARTFLETRRASRKRPCPPGHLFCLPCRVPRRPALDLVDYVALTPRSGNLRALCPTCEALMHRRIARSGIAGFERDLGVAISEPESTLRDTSSRSQNLDFETAGVPR